ncbi:MAG: type I restriction-modification system subunit M [Nitrososphaeria archaeon]
MNSLLGQLTRGDLEAMLKKAADLIRTRVDYRFILVLLFLKHVSDKWEKEYEEVRLRRLKDGFTPEEASQEAKNPVYHSFDLPEVCLWKNMRGDPSHLPERLSDALKALGEKNPDFMQVVESVDIAQFTSNRENSEVLRQLVELFSQRDLAEASPDVLGDAYEWILRYFAPTKAKEGEVFTPREIIDLLVRLVDPKPGESVYDPACGSAGMLIGAFRAVKERSGDEAEKLFLYGQEINLNLVAIAKMNAYLHGIENAHIEQGDSLLYPKFKEGGVPMKFDVVLANPPWNQDGYGEDTLKKGDLPNQRFTYGFPPNSTADWAWVQHMLFSAKEGGRVGLVIDNGALFRGNAERYVREKVVKDDLVECVILTAEKLFYNTGAPGALLIFRKGKPEERRGKVLFINASEEYEKHPEVRKLNRLGEKNVRRIAETYAAFREEEGFSRAVSIEEIAKNDYSLNVSLYVAPKEEGERIDVVKEFEEVKELERQRQELLKKIEEYVAEVRKAYERADDVLQGD